MRCKHSKIATFGLTLVTIAWWIARLQEAEEEYARYAVFQLTGKFPASKKSNRVSGKRPTKASGDPVADALNNIPDLSESDIDTLVVNSQENNRYWNARSLRTGAEKDIGVAAKAKRQVWTEERKQAFLSNDFVAKRCSVDKSGVLWERYLESDKTLTADAIKRMIAVDIARSVLYRPKDDPDLPPVQEYVDTLPKEQVAQAFTRIEQIMMGGQM